MGDVGTTRGLYTAQPEIRVAGNAQPVLAENILSLLVEETTEGLYRCEASFQNWGPVGGAVDYLYLDRQLLDFGTTFEVVAGSDQAEQRIFHGRITGLEAVFPPARAPEMTVLAEDRFQDLRMTRRTRTFEGSSAGDVIRRVADTHSLRTEIDIEDDTLPVVAQVNQSDLAFLRELARSLAADLWVVEDTLYVQSRNHRQSGNVTLTYGQGLLDFRVLADVARQRTSVTVNGWDVSAKDGVSHEADESVIRTELNGFQGGASVLQSAFGERKERIVHMAPFSRQEARSLSEAKYRQIAGKFVTGRGTAVGDGRIRVGSHLQLQGLGDMFGGNYYVTRVRHTFDRGNGYQTTFEVERSGIGQG